MFKPTFHAQRVGGPSLLDPVLLGSPSAGFHPTATGITLVLANEWTAAELGSRQPIEMLLHRTSSLVVLSLRLQYGLWVSMPWARTIDAFAGVPATLATPESRQLLTLEYVDCHTGVIERLRLVSATPAFSRAMVGALQACAAAELSAAEYFRHVDAFEVAHQSWGALKRSARERCVGGT